MAKAALLAPWFRPDNEGGGQTTGAAGKERARGHALLNDRESLRTTSFYSRLRISESFGREASQMQAELHSRYANDLAVSPGFYAQSARRRAKPHFARVATPRARGAEEQEPKCVWQ